MRTFESRCPTLASIDAYDSSQGPTYTKSVVFTQSYTESFRYASVGLDICSPDVDVIDRVRMSTQRNILFDIQLAIPRMQSSSAGAITGRLLGSHGLPEATRRRSKQFIVSPCQPLSYSPCFRIFQRVLVVAYARSPCTLIPTIYISRCDN